MLCRVVGNETSASAVQAAKAEEESDSTPSGSVIASSAVQPRNASVPMILVSAGTVKEVTLLSVISTSSKCGTSAAPRYFAPPSSLYVMASHPSSALSPIEVMPPCKVSVSSIAQPFSICAGIALTPAGTENDFSLPHSANAAAPISVASLFS